MRSEFFYLNKFLLQYFHITSKYSATKKSLNVASFEISPKFSRGSIITELHITGVYVTPVGQTTEYFHNTSSLFTTKVHTCLTICISLNKITSSLGDNKIPKYQRAALKNTAISFELGMYNLIESTYMSL